MRFNVEIDLNGQRQGGGHAQRGGGKGEDAKRGREVPRDGEESAIGGGRGNKPNYLEPATSKPKERGGVTVLASEEKPTCSPEAPGIARTRAVAGSIVGGEAKENAGGGDLFWLGAQPGEDAALKRMFSPKEGATPSRNHAAIEWRLGSRKFQHTATTKELDKDRKKKKKKKKKKIINCEKGRGSSESTVDGCTHGGWGVGLDCNRRKMRKTRC